MEQSKNAPQVDWSDVGALFPAAGYPTAPAVGLVDRDEYSALITYLVARSRSL